jgi:hypothetical protein
MVYPYLSQELSLREKLISNRIFIPRYWSDVEQRCRRNDIEVYLANHILPLPIDQRYGIEDMMHILSIINEEL